MSLRRAMWSYESVLVRAVLAFMGLVGLPARPSLAETWKDAILIYASMDGKADAISAAGHGQAALAGSPGFGPGRRGQGLVLPAGAGCSYAIEHNFRKEGGTLCAWVSLSQDTATWDLEKGRHYQWLFGVRNDASEPSRRNDLRVFFDRGLTFQYTTSRPRPSSGGIYVSDLQWTAGSWHHVGLTFRPREIRFYVDGQPREHTLSTCDTLAEVAGRILLGCADTAGHSSLEGTVDEFYVLSRPLSEREMKIVYLATGAAAGFHEGSLRKLEFPAARPPSSWPWSDRFLKLGMSEGVEQYLRTDGPTDGRPTVVVGQAASLPLATAPASWQLAPRPASNAGRTLAMWFRVPPRKAKATTAAVLSLRFQEPAGAIVNLEDDAASQRLTLAATDGGRFFGGNPSVYRLRAGAWHHLVLVLAPRGRAAWYLDGALQEEADAGIMVRGLEDIRLADGAAIAEAIVWGRPLSDREIVALFNLGVQGFQRAAAVTETEKPYWDETTAYRDQSGATNRVCLNALWRFLPAEGIEAAPPGSPAWGYSRIPGSFSAVHFFKVYDGTMRPIRGENWLDGKSFTRYSENRYDAGWYERFCRVPAEWKGRRISIVFDQLAAYTARVCVNGMLSAHFEQARPGEALLYPPRRIDVSQYAGQTIRLSLQVGWDNPGTCDLVSMGDVWLVGEPGWLEIESVVPITKIRPNKRLTLKLRLRNSGAGPAEADVSPRIVDHGRESLVLPRKKIHWEPGETKELTWEQPWPDARFWSPDDPYLYDVCVRLEDGRGRLLAERRRPFGFRDFWIEGRDFVLNGRQVHLRGTNCNLPCNYLFTHPEYVRGTYRARKELGFNMIQYWSDASVSAMGGLSYTLESMLDLCDEMGFIAVVGNVSHLLDVKDEAHYNLMVDEFTRKYGSHPSVCLWFVNPNTCWYNYGMHPGNLDCVYAPAEGEPGFVGQALARTAEKAVRAHDPQSRPVFTYASGNFGPLYSAMQYMALGLPIQEHADWPSLWAEAGTKPLFPVETDLKWTPHWTDFESYERSWAERSEPLTYYVEHAARYLGDSAYLRVDHSPPGLGIQRPEGILWHNLAAEPYALEVRAMAARDILRGWRGYGISAVTFHAEEDDLFENWSYHNKVFPSRSPAELQTPGPKPELQYQWFPRYLEASRPNQPFHAAFRKNFSPVLAFIGGTVLEPPRRFGEFTAKDHAFFAEETVEKEVVVVNDRTDAALQGRYEWQVVDAAGQSLQSGGATLEVPNGEIRRFPFRFRLPAVSRRTDFTIRLKVVDGDRTQCEDSFAIEAYPHNKPLAIEPVALLDTSDGKTGTAMQAAGIPFRRIGSAADLSGSRALVVGEGACASHARLMRELEQSGTLDKGVRILVLAQLPGQLVGLRFEPAYERYVWPRDRNSILAGIQADELANWRGASQRTPAYPPPNPATNSAPHYPGLKWHWGNRGIVATWPFRKPAYGNFRILADDGFDLVLSPLMEWLEGRGRVVLCQLDIVDRRGADPVATEVLRRLCQHVQNTPAPSWKTAAYLGSPAGREYLAPHHVAFRTDMAEDLSNIEVVVSDGTNLRQQAKAIDQFLLRGGTLFLLNPDVSGLRAVGLDAKEDRVWHALSPNGDWPLLAGVGPAELYWREPRSTAVLTNLPRDAKATDPAVVAEVPRGKGRIVVWTMSASLYDDWLKEYENRRTKPPRAYYAKTANHDKIHRALSMVLTNLGVRMRQPRFAVFAGNAAADRFSPYLENLSDYDINAFHNW